MDGLPPLDPGWPLVTRRGALALRVEVAIRRYALSESDIAALLGVSPARVRSLRNRARRIAVRIVRREFRYCLEDGEPLPVDARPDAKRCLRPSACRVRASRSNQ